MINMDNSVILMLILDRLTYISDSSVPFAFCKVKVARTDYEHHRFEFTVIDIKSIERVYVNPFENSELKLLKNLFST